MKKCLRLELDPLWEAGYIYTSCDIGGEGHAIVIEASDRDKFLDEWARLWRERATERLDEYEMEEAVDTPEEWWEE